MEKVLIPILLFALLCVQANAAKVIECEGKNIYLKNLYVIIRN